MAYNYAKDDPYSPYYDPDEVEAPTEDYLQQSPYLNQPVSIPSTTGIPPTTTAPDLSSYAPNVYASGSQGQAASASKDTTKIWTVPAKLTGSTTQWIPSGTEPQMAKIPSFEAPEWNEEEISRLTQKRAAPGVRRLRSAVQQAMAGAYESPQIKRMTLRQALAGYGMGLESVMSGAGKEAVSEYEQKYGREFTAEQMEWQANVQRLAQMYQGAMQSYMKGGTQQTTYQYGGQTTGEANGTYISGMTGHEMMSPGAYKPPSFNPETRTWGT